jgi:hypothetical protein
MSLKNIEPNDHKVVKVGSIDNQKIRSSQHSKIKKNIADYLRRKIDELIQKRDQAIV